MQSSLNGVCHTSSPQEILAANIVVSCPSFMGPPCQPLCWRWGLRDESVHAQEPMSNHIREEWDAERPAGCRETRAHGWKEGQGLWGHRDAPFVFSQALGSSGQEQVLSAGSCPGASSEFLLLSGARFSPLQNENMIPALPSSWRRR